MKNPTPNPSTPVAGGSPERFGYEWREYADLRPEHEEQFRRWTEPLGVESWHGRFFLDVGCGMGRNSVWPVRYGAAGGVAIDVDDRSLDSARRTLAEFHTVTVRKQSAYDIEDRDRFDVAFSIGVIHHLEFPERALAAMVRAVKPGGQVAIWVYGLENNEWIVTLLDPLRKALFSRLPIGFVHFLSGIPAAVLWLLLRTGFGRVEYFRLIRSFGFRHLRSIIFDQMLPKIANYWSRDQVEMLMKGAGLTDIDIRWVNQMSWAAAGTKPQDHARTRGD